MASFSDGEGRTWELRLGGVPGIREIKKKLGITICDVYDETVLKRLNSDFELISDIAWHLCGAQAKTEQVSKQKFEEELQGPILESARKAIWTEIEDFLPAQEKELLKLAGAWMMIRGLPADMQKSMLEGLDEDVKKAFTGLFTANVSDSPASSE